MRHLDGFNGTDSVDLLTSNCTFLIRVVCHDETNGVNGSTVSVDHAVITECTWVT